MGGCEIAMSSNLNSNRRGLPSSPLPVSPGWDFGKNEDCRLKAIADQSAGCWASKQRRAIRAGEREQMSLIVGLVQASSSRTASCTAQCLEANPVSSIGVVAAQ